MSDAQTHSTFASLWWYCWAGNFNRNQDFVLYSEIFFLNQACSPECLFEVLFNFPSICKFLKLLSWMCRPSRNVLCTDCSTVWHKFRFLCHLCGHSRTNQDAKESEKPQSKETNLQQARCYWKISFKKHSSSSWVVLRPCQVLKSWAV